MNFAFSRAGQEHVERLVELRRGYCRHSGDPLTPDRDREIFQELIAQPHLGETWLFWADGEVVGYAFLTFSFSLEFNGHDALLDELYILPEYRGHGLGKAGMQAIVQRGRELGLNALHLELMTDNAPAGAFYERLGFEYRPSVFMCKRLNKT